MRVTWSPESAWLFDITLEWDPNSEPDLKGYRIYHGKMSWYEAIGLIEAWCQANEPDNAKCIEEWEALCKDGSLACHYMLFTHDTIVDVKNVTQFTLTGLNEGKLYYFAATAYDNSGKESNFSIELKHQFGFLDSS